MKTGYYAGLLVGYRFKLTVVQKILDREFGSTDDAEEVERQLKKLARKFKCRVYLFGNKMGGTPSEQWVAVHPRMPKKTAGQQNCYDLSAEGFYKYEDITTTEFKDELNKLWIWLDQWGFNPGDPVVGTSWDVGL